MFLNKTYDGIHLPLTCRIMYVTNNTFMLHVTGKLFWSTYETYACIKIVIYTSTLYVVKNKARYAQFSNKFILYMYMISQCMHM